MIQCLNHEEALRHIHRAYPAIFLKVGSSAVETRAKVGRRAFPKKPSKDADRQLQAGTVRNQGNKSHGLLDVRRNSKISAWKSNLSHK